MVIDLREKLFDHTRTIIPFAVFAMLDVYLGPLEETLWRLELIYTPIALSCRLPPGTVPIRILGGGVDQVPPIIFL